MKTIDATEQAGALQLEEMVEIDSGDPEQPIVLCRIEQGLFAVSGICTHAFARMAEGYLIDQYLECPLHQAQFDVTSGQRVSGPECDGLTRFVIREQDDKVLIDMP